MKKIAITTTRVDTSGVGVALINLLNIVDYSNYEITLYLFKLNGKLMHSIPKQVKIMLIEEIDPNISNTKKILKDIKRFKFISAFEKFYAYYKGKFNNKITSQLSRQKYRKYSEQYDLVIDYDGPVSCFKYFTVNNLVGKKYVVIIHIDVSNNSHVCKNFKKNYQSIYKKYDKILCVSKYSMYSFKKVCPKLANKVDVMYNIVDVESILEKSEIGQQFDTQDESIKILTIGRLSSEKGIDVAINVADKLLQDGYKLKWYVCGEGEQREFLENLINEKNIQNNFILLGNQMNPFGYLRSCDIYVQPSRSEGYCTTTIEAKLLNKPIVATNVSGSDEQFINNETGLIVGKNVQSIYEGIKKLLDSKELKEKLSENLSKKNLSIINSLEKLYNLIN